MEQTSVIVTSRTVATKSGLASWWIKIGMEEKILPVGFAGEQEFWGSFPWQTGKFQKAQLFGEEKCWPLTALSSPTCLSFLPPFVLSCSLVSRTPLSRNLIFSLICIPLMSLLFPASFSGVFLLRLIVPICLFGLFVQYYPYRVSFSATPSSPTAHKSISYAAV